MTMVSLWCLFSSRISPTTATDSCCSSSSGLLACVDGAVLDILSSKRWWIFRGVCYGYGTRLRRIPSWSCSKAPATTSAGCVNQVLDALYTLMLSEGRNARSNKQEGVCIRPTATCIRLRLPSKRAVSLNESEQ